MVLEVVVACDIPKPCKFPSLVKRHLLPEGTLVYASTVSHGKIYTRKSRAEVDAWGIFSFPPSSPPPATGTLPF